VPTGTYVDMCSRLPLVDPGPWNSIKIGGLLPYQGQLLVSAYSYYDGDVNQAASHFVSGLDLSVPDDVRGPYRVGSLGPGFMSGYFGLVPSAWGLLALPASMLIGFATAAAGLAAVTFMRSWQDLDLLFTVTLPLFLFSGTFFPVTTYPEPLRTIVEFTPLYRGVDLVRGLTTGIVGWAQVIDVVYLFVMGVFFVWIASRRLGKMLIK